MMTAHIEIVKSRSVTVGKELLHRGKIGAAIAPSAANLALENVIPRNIGQRVDSPNALPPAQGTTTRFMRKSGVMQHMVDGIRMGIDSESSHLSEEVRQRGCP